MVKETEENSDLKERGFLLWAAFHGKDDSLLLLYRSKGYNDWYEISFRLDGGIKQPEKFKITYVVTSEPEHSLDFRHKYKTLYRGKYVSLEQLDSILDWIGYVNRNDNGREVL